MKIAHFWRKIASFYELSEWNEKKSVCSITLLYSSTIYSLFLPFFVLEISKFKYDKFFVRILLPSPNSNDLSSRAQIMVNLTEIFLGGMMLEVLASLVCGFKDLGWTWISSIDMEEGCCYWWDVAKHKSNWIEKSSLLCFRKILWLVDRL